MNMRCPYCQTELPHDATECTHCDWVRPSEARDTLAQERIALDRLRDYIGTRIAE